MEQSQEHPGLQVKFLWREGWEGEGEGEGGSAAAR